MTFSAMKARMSRAETVKEVVNKVKTNYPVDERFWTPTQDKKGEGKAVIRFLPAPEREAEDFAKFFTHYIKGQGRKYIERCRTTLGETDPAQELAQRLGANDKEIYSKYGRSARFIANIIVLNDPGDPENNGKVFLFEFGNKIMKKITKAMEGSDDPIDPKAPINVLCPWAGANFKVIVTKQGGNNNYDDSAFMAPSPLFQGDDKKIEDLWKTAYKLQPLIAPTTFKSYEELSKLLAGTVGDLATANGNANHEGEAAGVKATVSGARTAVKSGTATSACATQVAEKKDSKSAEEDPDKVFEELLSGTEAVSSDEAVDAMFADNDV